MRNIEQIYCVLRFFILILPFGIVVFGIQPRVSESNHEELFIDSNEQNSNIERANMKINELCQEECRQFYPKQHFETLEDFLQEDLDGGSGISWSQTNNNSEVNTDMVKFNIEKRSDDFRNEIFKYPSGQKMLHERSIPKRRRGNSGKLPNKNIIKSRNLITGIKEDKKGKGRDSLRDLLDDYYYYFIYGDGNIDDSVLQNYYNDVIEDTPNGQDNRLPSREVTSQNPEFSKNFSETDLGPTTAKYEGDSVNNSNLIRVKDIKTTKRGLWFDFSSKGKHRLLKGKDYIYNLFGFKANSLANHGSMGRMPNFQEITNGSNTYVKNNKYGKKYFNGLRTSNKGTRKINNKKVKRSCSMFLFNNSNPYLQHFSPKPSDTKRNNIIDQDENENNMRHRNNQIIYGLLDKLFTALSREKRASLRNEKPPILLKHPERRVCKRAPPDWDDYNSKFQNLQRDLLELQKTITATKSMHPLKNEEKEKNLTLQIKVIVDVVNNSVFHDDISEEEPLKKRDTEILKKKYTSANLDAIPMPIQYNSPLREPDDKKVMEVWRDKRVDNSSIEEKRENLNITEKKISSNSKLSDNIISNITGLLDTLLENHKGDLSYYNSDKKHPLFLGKKSKQFCREKKNDVYFLFMTHKPLGSGEFNFSEQLQIEEAAARSTTEKESLLDFFTIGKSESSKGIEEALNNNEEPKIDTSGTTLSNKDYLLMDQKYLETEKTDVKKSIVEKRSHGTHFYPVKTLPMKYLNKNSSLYLKRYSSNENSFLKHPRKKPVKKFTLPRFLKSFVHYNNRSSNSGSLKNLGRFRTKIPIKHLANIKRNNLQTGHLMDVKKQNLVNKKECETKSDEIFDKIENVENDLISLSNFVSDELYDKKVKEDKGEGKGKPKQNYNLRKCFSSKIIENNKWIVEKLKTVSPENEKRLVNEIKFKCPDIMKILKKCEVCTEPPNAWPIKCCPQCPPLTCPTPCPHKAEGMCLTVEWCCCPDSQPPTTPFEVYTCPCLKGESHRREASQFKMKALISTLPPQSLESNITSSINRDKLSLKKTRPRRYHCHHHYKNHSFLKEYKLTSKKTIDTISVKPIDSIKLYKNTLTRLELSSKTPERLSALNWRSYGKKIKNMVQKDIGSIYDTVENALDSSEIREQIQKVQKNEKEKIIK